MGRIEVNREMCKSCGLCLRQCPKGILHIGRKVNSKGYSVCEQTEEGVCTACCLCAVVCPDAAITVFKEEGGE